MSSGPSPKSDAQLALNGATKAVETLRRHVESLAVDHPRLSDVQAAEGRRLADAALSRAGEVLTRLSETPTS